MADVQDRLEKTTPEDAFIDYCAWEYRPSSPWEGKFRSVNLLFHSFEVGGMGEQAYALVDALREAFGVGRTVWGVKQRDGELAWEFYFYDYRRRERERSLSRFVEVLRPFTPCAVQPDEGIPYFMFSVDVNDALVSGRRPLEEVHLYIGNPGSRVSSGICYAVTPGRRRLENFYFFFDREQHLQDAASKAACSVHLDTTRIAADAVFRPELLPCKTLCVANKQENDSIYFSRVQVNPLLFFLREHNYPPELASFVGAHRADLDHLLYDVGFDYRMENGELRILKSGYYGFF